MSNPFLIRDTDEPQASTECRDQSAEFDAPMQNHPVLSLNPALPTPPVSYRSFGDVAATRRAIFDRVQQAASNLSVVDNPRYTLSLGDVQYAEQDDPTPDEIKRTLLENGTISKTLRGTWTLTDKNTGWQSQRKTVVAKVPYLLDNGTFLRNGTKYVLRNQSRLLAGVYARRKENGEHEVHVNADMRDGAIHHYGLDAETGQLNVIVSGSKTPIYGLAKSLGATDAEMIDAWGEELWRVNQKKFQTSQISKLYEKLARGRKEAKTDSEKMEGIRTSLERIKLNPEVMEATLGQSYDHLDKDVLLQATKKLIGISRGEAESDDRDNLAFQEVYGPEDVFEERLMKDSGSFRRMLLNNLTYRYGGNIEKLPAGALSKQIDGAILSSGLATNSEEINRLDVFDKAYALTKLGSGGVPSVQSVPDESRNVHPSQRAYIDPSRTPESLRVGVDTYLATACMKGSDRRLYAPVLDRNGEQKMLRPRDLLRATVAVASEYNRAAADDYIPVMQNGKEDLVRKDEVDYLIPNFEGAFSPLANLIPFKSAAQGNRVAMGSRMLTQALPLNHGEAPLVQSGIPGQPDRSYYQEFGKDAGAVFADQAGTVLEATDHHVLIENADGTKRKVNLNHYQVSNRKTYDHNTPMVTIGQRINPGDIIAKSNMTDDQGQIALGLNANVIMVPWKGLNFEDGMLISESFAKRMTSQHMYQNRIDWSPEYKQGKHAFMGIFPSTFNRQQLDRMDDNGVIRVGETVKSGDPLVLAARANDGGRKKGKRKLFSDATLTWDHHDDGVVTDVFHSDKGTAVLVKTESQMQEGDKLCVDEMTEVLTSEGWKSIANVTCKDKVACLNNDQLVYEHPIAVHSYPHGGRMYKIQSQQIDLFVTDEHKMYVQRRYQPGFELIEAKKIFGKRVSYKKDAIWYGKEIDYIVIPELVVRAGQFGNGQRTIPAIKMPVRDYLMLLGAYVCDGNLIDHPPSGSYGIDITKIKEPNRGQLITALKSAGIRFVEADHKKKVRIYSKQLLEHFRQVVGRGARNKRLPNYVFSYSQELLKVLFRWLMWGDGHSIGTRPIMYTTVSPDLADDVQRLCLHIGKAANIQRKESSGYQMIMGRLCTSLDIYDVRIINSKLSPTVNHGHVKKQSTQIEEWVEDYEKPVYCITVPSEVFYVRRNGKPVWCGNSNRFGNKGVVRILPDDEMPMTKDGMVAEVVLSPAATVSRGNPVQLAELALGKIAKATGKTYRVADFDDIDDLYEFVNQELDRHGIEPDSPIIDRKTGKEIYNGDGSGIANGSMWLMKLHHTSETKGSARGLGGYDATESPARGGTDGSKRMAPMALNALVAHGAYNTFMDAKYHRGQANDDYWLQYMSGANPVMKKTPLVYQKFENSLRASGIHVSPSEGRLNIMALTNRDVEQLAGDREVQSGETLRWEKDKNPIAGGLFDPTIFGMDGTRWGKMTPIVPILNPVMEEPARTLLGLKQKELKAIMAGDMEYKNYGTGFQAVGKALDDISVPLAMNGYRARMRNGRATERDHAVRALAYLKGCEATGIHPREWMLSSIPILPPKFRPVAEMRDSNVPLIDDANYLYKLMIDTNNGIKELRNITKNTTREEYGLYDAYKQVTGLAEPTHPKLVQRQVRGLLKHVFGVGSSKFSMVQRNLLGTPTDMVGRAVIVPNPDLDMDSVGIPEEKAWEAYRPHLVHRLTKRGVPWSQAAKYIESRSPIAKEALLQEMEERPVIVDRAPILHKWGIMAFKPRLVAGDSVHTNSFIMKAIGGDYDGDQVNYHIPSSPEAVKEAFEILLPSKSLIQSSDLKSAQPRIISENAGGLYLASLPPDQKQKPRTFVSWADAEKAYRRGDLAIDDPVVVLSSRPLPQKKGLNS